MCQQTGSISKSSFLLPRVVFAPPVVVSHPVNRAVEGGEVEEDASGSVHPFVFHMGDRRDREGGERFRVT